MVIDLNNINPSRPNNSSKSESVSNETVKPASTDEQNQSNNQDTVKLSPEVEKLNALKNTILEQPEVDEAKVNAIRESIANNSYVVDVNKLAEKIIADNGSL